MCSIPKGKEPRADGQSMLTGFGQSVRSALCGGSSPRRTVAGLRFGAGHRRGLLPSTMVGPELDAKAICAAPLWRRWTSLGF